MMHLTQGAFSFLPPLTDEQIEKQIQYALDNKWPVSLEYTDDPHPRNSYWDMFGLPLFDLKDAKAVLQQVTAAREAHPNAYIKLNAFDARLGRQTTALSFIVHRPKEEPGFRLERTNGKDRQVTFGLHSYATDKPIGKRYTDE
jgi:ribulose-bisphosphate carboxylase small chain